jgi:predicted flap endonuclease-1-like 5' DNA nuclease
MTKLVKVEGIGEVYSQKLKEAGVRSAEALLELGASANGRDDLAEKSGVSSKLILEWVNHVDLFRIKGVGEEYADLLEEVGVDSVPELAQRRADHLFEKMVATNAEKKLVRKLPTQGQVAGWIEQAKQLPRKVTH